MTERPTNCDPTSVARSCASGTPSASVIGPNTSRTSRSRIMPMAASLVSADRSMAMRRTRVSGGSQASRKVRTTVAPSWSTPAAMPRASTSPGRIGSSSASVNSASFDPK